MAINLPAAVLAFITALESVTGVPIAILERKEKTEEFWARSAAILCEKTKDNWCEEHVRFMTSNTELMGQSHIIEYDLSGTGLRRVCAIIPPIPDIDPSFISESFGRGFPNYSELPLPIEAASWLMLYHASHCLDATLSSNEEERAIALATLSLALLGGDASFISGGTAKSAARKVALLTGKDSAYWAAGTGERILMDLWKQETAYVLEQSNCYATVSPGTSIDTERISRAKSIHQGENCTSNTEPPSAMYGTVSDNNLWLWMLGPEHGEGIFSWPKVGVTPLPYTPAKSFPTMEDAASYILETANALAR